MAIVLGLQVVRNCYQYNFLKVVIFNMHTINY